MIKIVAVVVCLIATIHCYQEQYNFNIVLEETKYTHHAQSKYELLPSGSENSIEVPKKLSKIMTVGGTEAIVNEYADKIFENLQNFMVKQGFDPMEMPDMHTGFNYTLIITYHGEMDLTHGWIQDLSTIHRDGDAVVAYSSENKRLQVTVPIAFDDMQFSYDYSAKIMGLGPTGGIEGKVSNVRVEIKIGFDTETLVASLDQFYITNSGHITFHFNGNPLVDWLINLLTDVTTILLKKVILLVVESVIRGGLQNAIDAINDFIGGLINPTTIAPITDAMQYNFNYK